MGGKINDISHIQSMFFFSFLGGTMHNPNLVVDGS